MPMSSPELLPANRAQTAENCKLYSGELRPFGGLRRVYEKPASQAAIETIFRYAPTTDGDAKGLVTSLVANNPVEIESEAHGRSTGDQVFIAGVNGGSHALNNQLYTITVLDVDNFSLNNTDGTAMAAITSNGYWTLLNGYWFTSDEEVEFVRGPISGDIQNRTYYTRSGGAPRMTYEPIATYQPAYAVINVGGAITAATATGLTDDATSYSLEIGYERSDDTIYGSAYSGAGEDMQTYGELVTAIQANIDSIGQISNFPQSLTISIRGGNLVVENNKIGAYQDGSANDETDPVNVVLLDTSSLLTNLSAFVEVEGTDLGSNRIRGVDSTLTKTVLDPTEEEYLFPEYYYDLGLPAPDTSGVTLSLVELSFTVQDADQSDPCRVYMSDIPLSLSPYSFVNPFSSGDKVTFASVGGMTQLNGNTYTVNSYGSAVPGGGPGQQYAYVELFDEAGENPIDASAFGAFTSGGTISASVAGTSSDDDFEDRAYACSYVSFSGEEGPPSLITQVVNWSPGKVVTFAGLPEPPSGKYDIQYINIYRTAQGASGTDYFFVVQNLAYDSTATDAKSTFELAEVLPSLEWIAPPSDMRSMIALPNGVMAGISKNLLCMSVPNLPHAWPALYQQQANHDFVACRNFDTTVVAATHEDVYLANGATPEIITLEALQLRQGCVSARGMVSLGKYGVVYPSPDGLVMVSRSGVEIVTEGYYEREEWQQQIKPETIHAYYHEKRYYGFYDNGTTQGGFIFDPSNSNAGLVFIDTYCTHAYSDPISDTLYMQVGDYIEAWDTFGLAPVTAQTYTWRSKKFYSAEKASYQCAKVYARSYSNLTFRLYADDVLVHTETVTSTEPFRLSAYDLAEVHEIEIEGTDYVVPPIVIAETFEELDLDQ